MSLAELFVGAKVFAVVISKMAVACNRGKFDASFDQ